MQAPEALVQPGVSFTIAGLSTTVVVGYRFRMGPEGVFSSGPMERRVAAPRGLSDYGAKVGSVGDAFT